MTSREEQKMSPPLDLLDGCPGFRRRIIVTPAAGIVCAAVEDDFHCFLIRLEHAEGRVTALAADAERFPWTTCPAAGDHLAAEVTGRPLAEIAQLDPLQHCTHMFELIVLAAAHAAGDAPSRFDLTATDRIDGRTRVALAIDDSPVLAWDVHGSVIQGPAPWVGRELRRLSSWRQELTPELREWAGLLRRVVQISQGRGLALETRKTAADWGKGRLGACFTYQPARASEATRIPGWIRNFSDDPVGPLAGYQATGLR